jgi:large repetitive protein
VGRLGRKSLRLALVAVVVALAAGIGATVAHALAFDDAVPCPTSGSDFICPQGSVGAGYSIQLIGRGGCGPDGPNLGLPYQYRVLSGSLPPGLSLATNGTISGTPTQSGSYAAYIELSDEDPPSQSWCLPKKAERQFFFTINSGLQIVTNDLPQNASVGAPYSATLQAQMVTGLNPPNGVPATGATWSVVSGVGTGLPPGLSLGNGVISGTPTTEGTYTFRIQASLNGASPFQTYTLNVRKPLVATAAKPLATSPAPTVWEVGLPFSAKLTPSGGNGTYTVTLGSGALPTGLTLGPDGTISGTPSAAGVFHATVKLADSEGRTLDYAANFGVAERLAVGTIALKPAKVGRLYRAKLVSTGGVPVKKWKVLAGPLPKGIRFNPTLGTLAGKPTKAGRYRVTFQVTDGLKVVAKKTLRIVVAK